VSTVDLMARLAQPAGELSVTLRDTGLEREFDCRGRIRIRRSGTPSVAASRSGVAHVEEAFRFDRSRPWQSAPNWPLRQGRRAYDSTVRPRSAGVSWRRCHRARGLRVSGEPNGLKGGERPPLAAPSPRRQASNSRCPGLRAKSR